MNDSRRKQLSAATTLITQAIGIIEEVREEEQESFDNMPEGMQSGEKGSAMETTIAILDDAISSLEEADGLITDAQLKSAPETTELVTLPQGLSHRVQTWSNSHENLRPL